MRAVLGQWVNRSPRDYPALRALANLYLETQDKPQARRALVYLTRLAPNDAGALNDLALLMAEDDPNEALAMARRAYDIAPERVDVLDTLGWWLVQSGEHLEALGYLRDAHSRASDVREVRYHLGVALKRLGRSEAACGHLEAAVQGGAFDGAAAAARELAELDMQSR